MKVMIRMEKGCKIRDGSNNYACPNLYCWREGHTALNLYESPCPKCGIELDWNWIKIDLDWNGWLKERNIC